MDGNAKKRSTQRQGQNAESGSAIVETVMIASLLIAMLGIFIKIHHTIENKKVKTIYEFKKEWQR